MQDAFYTLTEKEEDFPSVKEKIQGLTVSSVCLNCKNKEKCKQKNNPKKADLDKIIEIGFAKGKISFVDLPSTLLETCVHPNDLMYSINKYLSEYKNRKIDEKTKSARLELIASQSGGVSEVLKMLALETGTLLKYHNKLERELTENLFKKGFIVSELLIYGEETSVSIGLIVEMKDFDLTTLISTVEKTLKIRVYLADKVDVTSSRVYLSLKKAPLYDAVFGLSTTKKDGSLASGDAHSVIRLKGDKFMVALSDGMGSGKKAESVSNVCLSLIESFYKAGLKSKLILDTVNKLLAVNTEDSFTALDVTVIDLNDLTADFIKYGSPYGFIVSNNQVKIIEGNTLPLGIIEDLTPAVCKTKVSDGDIILLLSDGVSDAFKSSSEIIDYLRTAPAFNPQTLADDILSKAIERSNGEKKDDMTALAVRIFKSAKLPS
jgi:stage II sporulation protein E